MAAGIKLQIQLPLLENEVECQQRANAMTVLGVTQKQHFPRTLSDGSGGGFGVLQPPLNC